MMAFDIKKFKNHLGSEQVPRFIEVFMIYELITDYFDFRVPSLFIVVLILSRVLSFKV